MGSSTTQTQNNAPYAAAQPFIDQGIQEAGRLYASGQMRIDPYSGQMVADYDPMRATADQAATGIFGDAIAATGTARAATERAMDPNYRTGAFDQIRENVIADIMPAINGSFAGSGMTGSSLHAQNLAKGLAAGLGSVENDFYQRGEDRALQAAGMSGYINQQGYGAYDFLQNAGKNRQDYEQDVINADVLRDQQQQYAPLAALQDYLSLTTGAGGQFGVSSSTSQQNPGLLQILGTGAGVAGVFV